MFEKCGMLDVFYGIWKQKWWILMIAIVCALAGFGLGILEAEDSTPAVDNDYCWVSSASFLVTDTATTGNKGEESAASTNQQKAYGILTVATADYKQAEIYSALTGKYTAAQICEGLNLDVPAEQLTFYDFNNVINGSVPSDSSIIHIFLIGRDEQLVTDYMELQKEIIIKSAEQVGECEVRFIDGITGQKATGSTTGLIVSISPVVQGILFGIVGLILAILLVVFKTIFLPTVNRRSDFATYNLTVLGEVSIKE